MIFSVFKNEGVGQMIRRVENDFGLTVVTLLIHGYQRNMPFVCRVKVFLDIQVIGVVAIDDMRVCPETVQGRAYLFIAPKRGGKILTQVEH